MKAIMSVQASCPRCHGVGMRVTEGQPLRDGTVRVHVETCPCVRMVILPELADGERRVVD